MITNNIKMFTYFSALGTYIDNYWNFIYYILHVISNSFYCYLLPLFCFLSQSISIFFSLVFSAQYNINCYIHFNSLNLKWILFTILSSFCLNSKIMLISVLRNVSTIGIKLIYISTIGINLNFVLLFESQLNIL